jgi:polyphosphate kinase
VRAELHNRRKGDAVRMEIEADADPEIIERLRTVFELDPWQVFPVNGPVNLSRLFNVYEQVDRPGSEVSSFSPRELRLTAKSKDLFEELRATTFCCTTPSIPTTRWFRSSSRRRKTTTCFPSSRRSTAPTNIR